ncbi:Hypothetical Protein FCC1311_035082 [Hondaea fermentalgiana]|uniref:MgtC/SapB/SrpB/YhiD N-terminal domain-containing protein n=1 Tax=Hondaea fermentalgiana TaxID=2315210 RepID=A0A2R5G898_9STRA|nr:Hypothetical Protein FCC1311_035082 [Hondaea fermentalgiana]|eukprot:GBG27286.1 Hypothetical Protein FCC1311_035082 [Hondaea fermentalgiana]
MRFPSDVEKDHIFEAVVLVGALTLAVLALFANPLCRVMVDAKTGCGVSLDDAMYYTLAHPRFNNETAKATWHNPGYIADEARLERRWFLLGMTLMEADLGRRMSVAVFSGAMIGFERRSADRPAGIRTMSLASLGACLFTIGGTWAFTNGWNNWDASRVSAAIPSDAIRLWYINSGVGFLGSGIPDYKDTDHEDEDCRDANAEDEDTDAEVDADADVDADANAENLEGSDQVADLEERLQIGDTALDPLLQSGESAHIISYTPSGAISGANAVDGSLANDVTKVKFGIEHSAPQELQQTSLQHSSLPGVDPSADPSPMNSR